MMQHQPITTTTGPIGAQIKSMIPGTREHKVKKVVQDQAGGALGVAPTGAGLLSGLHHQGPHHQPLHHQGPHQPVIGSGLLGPHHPVTGPTVAPTNTGAAIKAAIPGTKSAIQSYYGYGGYPRRPLKRLSKEQTKAVADGIKEVMEVEKSL